MWCFGPIDESKVTRDALTFRIRGLCAASLLMLAMLAVRFERFEACAQGNPEFQSESRSARPQPTTVNQSAFPSRADFVGDAICAQCHRDIANSYAQTSHHQTSQVANGNTILGDFHDGSNVLRSQKLNAQFEMDARGGKFYQTAMFGTDGKTPFAHGSSTHSSQVKPSGSLYNRTESFDLVIGSGVRGQNYLYWRGEELFELPVAYSAQVHQWIVSPGYRNPGSIFDRPILPRCLECHASYFQSIYPGLELNMYKSQDVVLGIGCEVCHGPGRVHAESGGVAALHGAAGGILNPAKLPAARQDDICAFCHAGAGVELRPAFTYVPGQILSESLDLGESETPSSGDVHGRQSLLMRKSRCFQMSATLRCTTCHDVHRREMDLAMMSQHCLACHQIKSTPAHTRVGKQIEANCIDCHMPILESRIIELDVDGREVRPRLRSHWIKVYPAAPKR
jgi:hypothetical protein